MEGKTCCFIGHRTITCDDGLIDKLFGVITGLIDNGVTRFAFGSKSQFDSLCHGVVTAIKEDRPNIIRIAYDTKSESSVYEKDREKTERLYSKFFKCEFKVAGYEEIVKDDKMYVSGRASYIERNMLMIDASDYCVFYYDESYSPPVRVRSKGYYGVTSEKSGTAIAYRYACKKGKIIINVFEN